MNNTSIHSPKNLKKTSYKPKADRSFKIILIAVLSFFVGFGLIVGFYSFTLISIIELSKFLALFAVLGFLIPLKFYRKWFHFIKYEMIIFNLLGVAPFFTGVFLLLNFIFVDHALTEQYKIEKIYFEGDGSYTSTGMVLENNIFSGERKIVELNDHSATEFIGNHYLQITIAEGLFGYQVIKEKKFINSSTKP